RQRSTGLQPRDHRRQPGAAKAPAELGHRTRRALGRKTRLDSCTPSELTAWESSMKQERLGSKTRLEATASTATLTLLRVVVGVIFVAHGWTKLTDTAGTANSFAGMGVPLPNVTPYLAIAGEFF